MVLMESGIQLTESTFPSTIGFRKPSSNDKESGVQNPSLLDSLTYNTSKTKKQ